jgi:Ser/Thr protein kinase RdoA (MazF antagonist)
VALYELLGEEPRRITPLKSGNNGVFQVETGGGESYILKCFEEKRPGAYEREIGMRECLRRFSDVRYPRIIDCATLMGRRFVLMERVVGESLENIWSRDKERTGNEVSALGRMLAFIHSIPLAEAKRFLKREEVLYSEEYFAWMLNEIGSYARTTDQLLQLSRCYEVVRGSLVEEVVIHADFGPHQVIVDREGDWVLVDFEYAALAAFADDVAGTEVRLEQKGFRSVEEFLAGYGSLRPVLREYEEVRSAYKAYNLLAMLTYRLAQKGEEPPAGELCRLGGLLAEL